MGNLCSKAALMLTFSIALSPIHCYAADGYGGVWGNTGNILEDEEVISSENKPEKPAETEGIIIEVPESEIELPSGAAVSVWGNSTGTVKPSDKENSISSENKLSDKKKADKKKTEKIVDSTDSKYSYSDMCEDIDKLVAAYPKLVRVNTLGTTADKRKIYDIVIGDPEAEKQIVIQAGCHGREYMTCLLAMDMAEYCLIGYDRISYKGRLLSEYFDEFQIHIIPMLNPDGVTISQFGAKGLKNPQLRKNVSVMYKNALRAGYTTHSEARYYERWKANAKGIDINCNFDGKWDSADTGRFACGWGYKGNYPESESESKGIVRLINSLSNPVTVVSYHASGSVVWWDYNQKGDFRDRCYREAKLVSDITGYSLYPCDPTSAAGLCDRIIAKGGKKTVPILIEIGKGDCPLSISEYEEIFKKNYSIIPALMEMYY